MKNIYFNSYIFSVVYISQKVSKAVPNFSLGKQILFVLILNNEVISTRDIMHSRINIINTVLCHI